MITINEKIMKKTKVWSVPEGYEIDKEQSNERKIVLKKIEEKRANSWKEYCDMMKGKDSYVVDMYGNVRTTTFSDAPVVGEFEDKEGARVFAAFSRLIKLRKNWVGDWKPDWESGNPNFIIVNKRNNIEDGVGYYVSSPMIFPTAAMRDEFHATFKELLEIAKPLL